MARGRKTPDAVRAQVMAALLTGQGVMEVAQEYDLPHPTISDIKASFTPEQFDEIRRKKGERLSDLLIEYVNTNIETLTAQSIAVRDPAYVKAQSASELATLHGVLADKTIRILAALEPTEG